jgi:hypothetical protein
MDEQESLTDFLRSVVLLLQWAGTLTVDAADALLAEMIDELDAGTLTADVFLARWRALAA